MFNLFIFLSSCILMAGFAWFFLNQGKSTLIAWIAILSLTANLFVLKQVEILGFNATASDIFAVASLLGLNLLQEKYGRAAAQRAIWTSFSCLSFFMVVSQLHLQYEPSAYDNTQNAYMTLLTPAPRILFASLITFFIVDQCDSRLYHLLRQRFPKIAALWISGATIAASQLLDTLLFSLLGLYGMVSALIEIMMVSYAIKLLAIINTLPWSFITQRLFVKKSC